MTHAIEVRDLSFSYGDKNQTQVFSNINLALEQGEIFCLLGPNGSGKSTLLKCMVNLLKGFGGRVLINGKTANNMPPDKIAAKIGYVPQSLVSAFPFKVADIVVMGRAARISLLSTPATKDWKKAHTAMERIGIAHLANRPCTRLSGGEWQMVLIARALTQSPGILILDEPTSHLDLGNQVRILEVIDGLSSQGMTIITASHFPDHAFINAGKTGILKQGRLTALGRPESVLSESVLEETYGINVRVVRLDGDINRKVCVPVLRNANHRLEN